MNHWKHRALIAVALCALGATVAAAGRLLVFTTIDSPSRSQSTGSFLSGTNQPTVVGLITLDDGNTLNLQPVVLSEKGTFTSLYPEASATPTVTQLAMERLRAFKVYHLYFRGVEVATFSVQDVQDKTADGQGLRLQGQTRWTTKPVGDMYAVRDRAIALSRPIPQPFWPKALRLSAAQNTSLEASLTSTLKQATSFVGSQRVVGSVPKQKQINVMDLDRDGQPEVFAQVRWQGRPCDEMYATVFAVWRQRWEVFRSSTYLAECAGIGEAAGDDLFSVLPVDITGDGVAELLVSEGRWESWQRAIYSMLNGTLVKVRLGAYGS